MEAWAWILCVFGLIFSYVVIAMLHDHKMKQVWQQAKDISQGLDHAAQYVEGAHHHIEEVRQYMKTLKPTEDLNANLTHIAQAKICVIQAQEKLELHRSAAGRLMLFTMGVG